MMTRPEKKGMLLTASGVAALVFAITLSPMWRDSGVGVALWLGVVGTVGVLLGLGWVAVEKGRSRGWSLLDLFSVRGLIKVALVLMWAKVSRHGRLA